jgi:hypothetical protein
MTQTINRSRTTRRELVGAAILLAAGWTVARAASRS